MNRNLGNRERVRPTDHIARTILAQPAPSRAWQEMGFGVRDHSRRPGLVDRSRCTVLLGLAPIQPPAWSANSALVPIIVPPTSPPAYDSRYRSFRIAQAKLLAICANRFVRLLAQSVSALLSHLVATSVDIPDPYSNQGMSPAPSRSVLPTRLSAPQRFSCSADWPNPLPTNSGNTG